MRRKFHVILVVCTLIACFSVVASAAELSVGVQNGDWIEYTVSSTGAPILGHDVEWARMEIKLVQNPNITVTIMSRYSDGTNDTITFVLNLETGHLIDDFIIPANLNVGDTFKDENYGNITITDSEVRTYAGAQRTILTASIDNNTYYWDQTTGVSVEGNTKTADYTIHSVISATNLWQPTITQTFDFVSIILVASVFLIILIVFMLAIVRYSKRKLKAYSSTN